jgi:gp1.2
METTMITRTRIRAVILAIAIALVALTGCSSSAEVASDNLAKASENFEVERRIVFFNGITDTYLLSIEGKCSISDSKEDNSKGQVEVTCKVGDNKFKKHILGLSDNVSYFVEQTDAVETDPYHYRVTFRPQTIVPDVDLQTSGQAG